MIYRSEVTRILLCLAAAIAVYLLLIFPFARQMQQRPLYERLGHIPEPAVLKALSADQQATTGALLMFKVLMYFGGLSDPQMNTQGTQTDYPAMIRLIDGVVKLDPYNMDAYYFSQATLAWDERYRLKSNQLLEYGMGYRTWDWYLPFFAGFNRAYFDKDYARAAEYYRQAGELSGANLYKSLAGRYLQESGRTDLAIAYLSVLEKRETNAAIKRSYQLRLEAYRGVQSIEHARDSFVVVMKRNPVDIAELLRTGHLKHLPIDPYGGKFSLTPDGNVQSTSRFAAGYLQSGKRE